MVSTSFYLSTDLFHRSFEPGTWAERITDLGTALEAALIGGDGNRLDQTGQPAALALRSRGLSTRARAAGGRR